MALPQIIQERVNAWLQWDMNAITRDEVKNLLATNPAEIIARFSETLKFGTAGLRSKMAAGPSMMNDLTVIQATQGLACVLKNTFSNIDQRVVIVGYDGRHNSERFALLAANVFLLNNIHVKLFSQHVVTPFVPYAVRHFSALCGVMITASHNPKDDNGYKLYWENGAQVTSPLDKDIQTAIEKSQVPMNGVWNVESVRAHSLCSDPFEECFSSYFKKLIESCNVNLCRNCPVHFTYTAMHGVGYIFAKKVFDELGLSTFIPVSEQILIDPEFPTVKFPNPEEGKEALDLAISTADRNNSTLILANDPDADRLAVAEKQLDGKWKLLSGNEVGTLLGWYIWTRHINNNPSCDRSRFYMVSSTVSSKILRSLAEKEGFNFEETLTGFKWMGNLADSLLKKGNDCLFAFEEAIGFMCGSVVLDKDGISALALIIEMVAYLAATGLTLSRQLMHIYSIYGYHLSYNSYYLCYDPPTIKKIFDRIRNYEGIVGTYPKKVCSEAVLSVRDLTIGYDSTTADGKPKLPSSSSSQMITFCFANNVELTLRTSGTEPKIKFYSELIAKSGEYQQLLDYLAKFVTESAIELLEPEKHGLIAKH